MRMNIYKCYFEWKDEVSGRPDAWYRGYCIVTAATPERGRQLAIARIGQDTRLSRGSGGYPKLGENFKIVDFVLQSDRTNPHVVLYDNRSAVRDLD